MSSRTSDFYARTARRPLAIPDLARYRRIVRASKAKAITRTQMQLSPRPKVRTLVTTKMRPTEDKGVRLVNIMRRRLRGPLRNRRGTNKQEYMYTPAEGNSVSYFTRKPMRIRGMKKKVMRTAPIQQVKTEVVGSLSWAYGRQAAYLVTHNTNLELDTATETAVTNNTADLMIMSSKIHYMLSSGSKAGIKLRIYEGVYKRDMPTGFDVITLWTNGMLDSGNEAPTNIESKPWSSPSFNQFCHISKVTNCFLPQGRTHEHYSSYGYNKLYNKEMYNASTAVYLRGWTRFTMFVCYGEPVGDSADADVTTGSGRLLITASKNTRFKFNQPTARLTTFTRSIPITGITTERLLDEGSGEVEAQTVV